MRPKIKLVSSSRLVFCSYYHFSEPKNAYVTDNIKICSLLVDMFFFLYETLKKNKYHEEC